VLNSLPACAMYRVLMAVGIWAFWRLPIGDSWPVAAGFFAVGFLVYGPQFLVGVTAADLATKRAARAAGNAIRLMVAGRLRGARAFLPRPARGLYGVTAALVIAAARMRVVICSDSDQRLARREELAHVPGERASVDMRGMTGEGLVERDLHCMR
jgi:hypothetical protein